MRFLVSSPVKEYELYRSAAKQTIVAFCSDVETASTVILSEEGAPQDIAPVEACREMVRSADCVVGIYGTRYGYVDDTTNLSITELEARWAVDEFKVPLLGFILRKPGYEPAQQEFIDRISHFRSGVYIATVDSIEELKFELYRALSIQLPKISAESAAKERAASIRSRDLRHLVLPLTCTSAVPAVDAPGADAVDLDVAVRKELAAGTEVIFVLGEVGSGKTWYLKQLYATLVEGYNGEGAQALPEFADLGDIFAAAPGLATNPVNATSSARARGFVRSRAEHSVGSLAELEASQAGVFLLDAYDEAVAKNPPGSRLRLLELTLGLSAPGRQLVITSRSHLFDSKAQIDRLVGSALRSSAGGRRARHAVFSVNALTSSQVRQFLTTQYGDSTGEQWRNLSAIIDLPDLARRPVLLPMVCDSLGELESADREAPVTGGALYEVYLDRWLARESWRLRLSHIGARRLFQDLALLLHTSATDSFYFDDLPQLLPEYFPQDILNSQYDEIAEALRVATFLRARADGTFTYAHRSFAEYFLAERIVEALLRRDAKLDLRRFPSKVTDAFAVDLLVTNPRAVDALLEMAGLAESPVFRYLCPYLLARVQRRTGSIDLRAAESRLKELTGAETEPFVTRELLVTLIDLGAGIDPAALQAHLGNPIPRDVIRSELKDYYGSLEEARLYLVSKLDAMVPEPLRLFYLISLCGVADGRDMDIFERYRRDGVAAERRVAQEALDYLGEIASD
ncbi:DUF4062 domain-containing protein [Kribbella sp. NPDC006257]|uniref:DUF4062 domain-containing protein n=1 Tax=Kribbella sp. NPDC006257 TaxID=3156738 RepID=UPI0033A36B1F